ncbi:MAG: hypothetical protein IPL27_26600 [Lewinellaceae bacterium]|nr:hypothetical protein [Lewinellaceae bacterium]
MGKNFQREMTKKWTLCTANIRWWIRNTGRLCPAGKMYLLKTDASGNPQWEKYYGGIKPAGGADMQPTTDGGFILMGTKYIDDFNGNIYVAKINSSGDLQWEKTFEEGGVEEGNSVQQTTDGGFILLGSTNAGNIDGCLDMYLIKIDASGNLLWKRHFGTETAYDDYGHSVQQTADGGFILLGTTINSDEFVYKMYLVKPIENGKSILGRSAY